MAVINPETDLERIRRTGNLADQLAAGRRLSTLQPRVVKSDDGDSDSDREVREREREPNGDAR